MTIRHLSRKGKEIENNKQGKNNLLSVKACVAIDSTNTWIMDSGATHHICNSMHRLRVTKTFRVNEFTLHLGDGSIVKTSAMGDVTLDFNNFKYLILKDCYYIPVFK